MNKEIKKELLEAMKTYKPVNANWFIFENIINKAIQDLKDTHIKDMSIERKRIIKEIEMFRESAFSSQIIDWDKHICNGQDGNDVSFTKKSWEYLLKQLNEEK